MAANPASAGDGPARSDVMTGGHPMPDGSIKIEGKPAVFTPDIEPFKRGTPLKVVQGDLVSWNNQTDEPHFLVPDDTASFGVFMTAAIAPDDPSGAYNVIAKTGSIISYHCSL